MKDLAFSLRRVLPFAVLSVFVVAGTLDVRTQQGQPATAQGEWLHVHGDKRANKYSPLDQINRDNVKNLKILWRRPGVDDQFKQGFPDFNPSNNLRSTPLMVKGVLYASDAVGLVEAWNPETGATIWVQEPSAKGLEGLAGQPTRGIAYWTNGSDQRIFSTRGEFLYAIDAKTGALDRSFGDRGRVNLHRDDPHAKVFNASSGPAVAGNIVIVGGGGGGGGDYGDDKVAAPEDVRGYDVRSGKLVWTFHVFPRAGEFGHDTWGGESANFPGNNMGAWPPITVDDELGYVYLPLGAPTNPFFGGHRPGQNLFANSLVCVDAKTGKRVWHQQLIHHDLWDYDLAASPILADITVNGRRIKAVIATIKSAYIFTFDRVTGEPVWPIEERQVPASDVPGEHAWPTQPFPTKPAAVDRQGITENDLIDFTPELKAEALAIIKKYRYGPVYTPPSLTHHPSGTQGTISSPAGPGGLNWNGGAFDPDTGMLYMPSVTAPWVDDLVKPKNPNQDSLEWVHGPDDRKPSVYFELLGPRGLPLTKPPYGRITAIDMNRGEHVWVVANGDGPRDHPAVKHLNLPPLGQAGRAVPLLTKTLLFIGNGSVLTVGTYPVAAGGHQFRALDKVTGKTLWETELPGSTTGAPMTYMFKGKQYIVAPVGDKDHTAEWVALGLP